MRVSAVSLRVFLFVLAVASLLWGYQTLLLVHAPVVFADELEDLSYGWFVPVFSLYVMWRERREIARSVGAPSLWGLLAALPFLFAGFLGVRGSQIRLEIVGFVGLLLALTWTFWGVKTAKRILFPSLFLLFCMPLHTYLDLVTIHLRVFAVSCAYGFLKAVGVDVIREGTMLLSPTGAFGIDVADPCSGMRSLFAMMAVTAGYAYFTQPTWFRRGLLFAASIPIVVFGNVMRIFSIVLTAATCSQEFATGFYHDYSGYVVFLVSVALMVGVGGLITKLCDQAEGKRKKEKGISKKEEERPSALFTFYLLLITFATVVAMVYQARTVEPVLCEAPKVALKEMAGYASERLEPGEAELTILPKDTQFDKRVYTLPNGHWFAVSVVIGGKSKSSIHRPELCLPSHGNQMLNPHTITVGERDWHRVTLAHRDRPSMGFAYTFFNQTGFATSSHLRRIFRDVWDRSVLGRIDRWVMVTVSSSVSTDAGLAYFLNDLEEVLK